METIPTQQFVAETLSNKGLEQAMAEFELELEGELTHGFTQKYLSQLETAIGETNSPYEFLDKGEKLHFKVAHDVYAPLLLGFAQFMGDYFSGNGLKGNIYFALRDSAPLLKISQLVLAKYDLNSVGAYINRPLCGIGDEINPEETPNGDMAITIQKYLKQLGAMDQEMVGWVDTGCWGTVPLVLKTHYFQDKEFYPIFFYSHNLHIPDYLHWIADGLAISEEELNCINDSLECIFPSPVRRPLLLKEEYGSINAKLKPSSIMSQTWGQAALNGVEAYGMKKAVEGISIKEQKAALVKFSELIKLSQDGVWTGTLWHSTPLWSQGEKFLEKFPNAIFGI